MTKDNAREAIPRHMLRRLEEATGHRFADLQRLDRALTHASARSKGGRDYERLEFLGDRVLGLCVAECCSNSSRPQTKASCRCG
jgi:ribonuclease-3